MRAVYQNVIRFWWSALRKLCLLAEFKAGFIVPFGERQGTKIFIVIGCRRAILAVISAMQAIENPI